jgi:hypothetical protein
MYYCALFWVEKPDDDPAGLKYAAATYKNHPNPGMSGGAEENQVKPHSG